MGAANLTSTIQIPINGLIVMALTAVISVAVYLLIYRMGWGKQVRAVMANRAMAGAVGIDTERVDRFTFGIGCGIAGVAGSAFTMIGSTSPTAGQLYIVDTFLVVVFGGAQSLLGTIASAFTISQARSTLEFFLQRIDGPGPRAAGRGRHPDAAAARPVRPQSTALRHDILEPQGHYSASCCWHCWCWWSSRCGLDPFRLNLFGKYLTYGFVALGLVLCWGDAGILSLGQGIFFGLGGYCMAMFLKLEASTPAATKIQSTPGIPDFMDWNQIDPPAVVLAAVPQPGVHHRRGAGGADAAGACDRRRRCSNAASAAPISPSSPRRWRPS